MANDLTSADDFQSVTDSDSRLAVELAIGVSDVPTILKRYGLSVAKLKCKLRDPMFKGMVKSAREVWGSDLSVKERIRIKSQMLTEDSLLSIFKAVHDPNNALPAKLDAFKQLATIADVNRPTQQKGAEGSKFTVTINLGENQPVVIDGESQE